MSRIYRIGSLSTNDIVLNSPYVSRSHADICCNDDGTYILTDHSTNGTVVNGIHLSNNSMPVRYGDAVMFSGKVPFDWNKINPVQGNGYQQPQYNNQPQRQGSSSYSAVDIILAILSLGIPFLGFFMYFLKRKENPSTAKLYLICACIGVVGLIAIGM